MKFNIPTTKDSNSTIVTIRNDQKKIVYKGNVQMFEKWFSKQSKVSKGTTMYINVHNENYNKNFTAIKK
jgi:hypothetical protein